MEEIFWWKVRIEKNRLIKASIQTPKAILTIDVPYDVWRNTLRLQNPEEKIWFLGDQCKKWRLSSSNQRETAAVLCSLTSSESFLKNKQNTALKIQKYNSTTSQNLNKRAAQASLRKLTNRILNVVVHLNIKVHTSHIRGKRIYFQNLLPDQ
ncbi:MAG: hypothetical protein EZS28_044966 [Streblomastix strix]|uniref:Uncharacterized protein n=1 Tax=Streblomastix strix TaxID=222440 RepID=A0A5J4TMH1_9EUKA|nr:MAG: hypothetical protein EZS28_044966 [Streblomastix strix]